ncbi:MAG: hypothetical protein JSR64_15735 [Nitrospira sp.]|nr:hypothetical protein [Nitrospira sp.]
MSEQIPLEILQRARRALKRRVAGYLILAMAEEDIGPDEMAEKLDEKGDKVRATLNALIEGESMPLDRMSDLALAMAREWDFSFRRIGSSAPPDQEPQP